MLDKIISLLVLIFIYNDNLLYHLIFFLIYTLRIAYILYYKSLYLYTWTIIIVYASAIAILFTYALMLRTLSYNKNNLLNLKELKLNSVLNIIIILFLINPYIYELDIISTVNNLNLHNMVIYLWLDQIWYIYITFFTLFIVFYYIIL